MSDLANLRSRRRATVSLGEAPDGLPWRLVIDRGASATELLAPIAGRLGYDSPEQYRGTAFGEVATRLNELFEQRDVKTIDVDGTSVDCYVTGQPVSRILGTTLLARLVTKLGVTVRLGSPAADTRSDAVRATATVAPAEQGPPPDGGGTVPVRAGVGVGHLAIPLNGSGPLIVIRTEKYGSAASYRFVRPFVSESLAAFRSARFDLNVQRSGEHAEGPMSDLPAYQRARRQIARLGHPFALICRVERAEVAGHVADIADSLVKLHKEGRVHGDFKPANVLLTGMGVQVIDSLDLAPGTRSPAMTPGWAAPEQVVGGNVGYATDQYAVGLLLCELLQGVTYGEEVHFLVPVGGNRTERFTLLRNPGVYLAPECVPVEAPGLERWHRLLDRCLRFVPEDRFPSMADLAAEIRELAAIRTVRGELEMTLWFGNIEEDEEDQQAVWRLQDTR